MRGVTTAFLKEFGKDPFNERVIYQLGNRREEDIKTILKEECWYRV